MLRIMMTLVLALTVWGPVDPARADSDLGSDIDSDGLVGLSLEELMDIPVVSAAKKSVRLGDSPAAVYVVTSEDIRRFGFTCIPEALRLVPGVNVARIDASGWAVSIRGFNRRFANKLLVLVDGRSVYSPMFSGTIWEKLDVVMEDVERIEVVRGPGATLWGTNAVNGVINIITKNAGRTTGGMVIAGGGNFERFQGVARYGQGYDDKTYVRGFAKYRDISAAQNMDGDDLYDASWTGHGGFRADLDLNETEELMIQGTTTFGEANQTDVFFTGFDPPYKEISESEGNYQEYALMARWHKVMSESSDIFFQTFWDQERVDYVALGSRIDRIDFDFSHRFLAGKHELIWGTGYRLIQSHFDNTFSIEFPQVDYQDWVINGFLQDEFVVVPDRLNLVLGLKLEYTTLSDMELQPNFRFMWTPSAVHSVWGSVARAAVIPSFGMRDVRITIDMLPPGTVDPAAPVTRVSHVGNVLATSESVLANELGYRVAPADWLSVDLATFYNIYDNLTGSTAQDPSLQFEAQTPYLEIPYQVDNLLESDTWGGELLVDIRPVRYWRLRSSWSRIEGSLTYKGDPNSVVAPDNPEHSPRNQVSVWSSLDIASQVAVEIAWRYVDPVPDLEVPDYNEIDARVSWRVTSDLELGVSGHNLLNERHQEFNSRELVISEVAMIPRYYGVSLRLDF